MIMDKIKWAVEPSGFPDNGFYGSYSTRLYAPDLPKLHDCCNTILALRYGENVHRWLGTVVPVVTIVVKGYVNQVIELGGDYD
jgi:hypothetical protein